MTAESTLTLECREVVHREFSVVIRDLRLTAKPRSFGGGWGACALDRVTLEEVGSGTGRDEYEALAAAVRDAEKRAERVLRSTRDPVALELLARVPE